MTKADRLSRLMQRLRHGGPHRAADLAAMLGVTVRTVYRDMDALRAGGLPVAGTRGTGYRITAALTLPALHLSAEELEALQIGLLAVGRSGDPDLARAAQGLSDKIDAALPEDGRAAPGTAPQSAAARAAPHLPVLRQAIRARQKVSVAVDGPAHVLRPLRLEFWGRLWTLTAWDETAGTFGETALDRIETLEVLPSLFAEEPGRRVEDIPGTP